MFLPKIIFAKVYLVVSFMNQIIFAKLWEQLTGLTHSKKLLGSYNRERCNELVKLGQRNLRLLTGFLSGHADSVGMRKKLLNTCCVIVMQSQT